jgi:hypothetical protein
VVSSLSVGAWMRRSSFAGSWAGLVVGATMVVIMFVIWAAGASAATWTVKRVPSLGPNGLTGVTCLPGGTCIAVGNGVSSQQPLVEAWNGGQWHRQRADGVGAFAGVSCDADQCLAIGNGDEPFLDAANLEHGSYVLGSGWGMQNISGVNGSSLAGISCVANSDWCMIVGSQTTSGKQMPLVLVPGSGGWAIVNAPFPSGGSGGQWSGVSCTAVDACTLVGSYTNASGKQLTLADNLNINVWTLLSPINRSTASADQFSSIACDAATSCLAVGSYTEASGRQLALAEQWDASGWTLRLPEEPGKDVNVLSSVACTAQTSCTAVGYRTNHPGRPVALIEAWNGTGWALEGPHDRGATISAMLLAVTCLSPTSCVSAGGYTSGVDQTLAESWNGATWTVLSSSNQSGTGDLDRVSCVSASWCVAIGGGVSGFGASTWNGTSWESAQLQPRPANSVYSILNDVSCFSMSDCSVIGDGFSEHWNGISWTAQDTANPSSDLLFGLSCPTKSSCIAVGVTQGGSPTPLAERWNGSSWTVRPAVTVPNAVYAYLYSVSCTSATSCMAIGYYNANDIGETAHPFAESWDGSNWTLLTIPEPTGETSGQLTSLSCGAPAACVAVGVGTQSNSIYDLIGYWNGTSWTTQALPGGGIPGVSCIAATTCFATGGNGDSASPSIWEWNGSSWTPQPAPDVLTAIPGAGAALLGGISCTSDTACAAVGFYDQKSDDDLQFPFAEELS